MPGVPLDAVDNVKKLLKGMFRRGKNRKPQEDEFQSQAADATETTAPTVTSPEKPIPPTQPLVTGQQDKPQEAIPINHEAQPGPPAIGQDVNAQDDNEHVPASSPVAAAAPTAEPTSAIVKEANVGGAETDKPTDASAPVESTIVKENATPSTETPAVAATPDIPAQTSASEEVKEVKDSDTPVATEATVSNAEPPAIPKPQLAPGMSATSGPLEDYPEHGDQERK